MSKFPSDDAFWSITKRMPEEYRLPIVFQMAKDKLVAQLEGLAEVYQQNAENIAHALERGQQLCVDYSPADLDALREELLRVISGCMNICLYAGVLRDVIENVLVPPLVSAFRPNPEGN